MYSACIHCSAQLGSNALLERFPVGRRIAFDQRTGRLWAVCRACERWNLSPLETRWEAIEDAERLFRATPLKAQGENIALAQTAEGLELVRIGAPPKTELLAWRYGDQFGRRRRKHLVYGGIGLAGMAGAGLYTLSSLAGIGVGLAGVFSGLSLLNNLAYWQTNRGLAKRLYLEGSDGAPVLLTKRNAKSATLIPNFAGGWKLELGHLRQIGKPGRGVVVPSGSPLTLEGDAALRAISRLLPHINDDGGGRRQLRDAAATIEQVSSVEALLRMASVNEEARKTHLRVKKGRSVISALPPRIRLAMEMALHEDDERRAMEGELAELERRWREADAIAKIADSLLLPETVDAELTRLRDGETQNRSS